MANELNEAYISNINCQKFKIETTWNMNGPVVSTFISYLQSSPFIWFLEHLSGIRGLVAGFVIFKYFYSELHINMLK